jgi:hypothetical protein
MDSTVVKVEVLYPTACRLAPDRSLFESVVRSIGGRLDGYQDGHGKTLEGFQFTNDSSLLGDPEDRARQFRERVVAVLTAVQSGDAVAAHGREFSITTTCKRVGKVGGQSGEQETTEFRLVHAEELPPSA